MDVLSEDLALQANLGKCSKLCFLKFWKSVIVFFRGAVAIWNVKMASLGRCTFCDQPEAQVGLFLHK